MKKTILYILLLVNQTIQAQECIVTIKEKDLIPEGITFDPTDSTFYISSIYKSKIIKASSSSYSDFIASRNYDFMGGVGLHIDKGRNTLWACTGNIMGKKFQTGIFAFDLKSGDLIKKMTFQLDTISIFFNDLVITNDGTVYITDTFGHCIWVWNVDSQTAERIENLRIKYPNGIDISPDNKYLFVTSSDGLQKVSLIDFKASIIKMPEKSIPSRGLDGIAFFNKSIIGVMNGVTNKKDAKIVRFYLNDDFNNVEKTEIIDQNNPLFDLPTTLVINKDDFYVLANSQIDNLDQEKLFIKNPEGLKDIYVIKYKLK